jgi:glyoxylase-like metal-dependent hydrolase (beta-lactamase superfamily II)
MARKNMEHELTAIDLRGVNCDLLGTGNGFVLIDTGFENKRAMLEKGLASAGKAPGSGLNIRHFKGFKTVLDFLPLPGAVFGKKAAS